MALLTADDVLNKKFQPTKFREGYDQDEVDDFLDEVVNTLRIVTAENEELKAKLAAAEARAGELSRTGARAPQPEPQAAPAQPMPSVGGERPTESAVGMLALAQRMHDEYIHNGQAEGERIVHEARAEAGRIVRDAEDERTRTMEQLEQERTLLERKIDELRMFEREYRARLKSFLEGLLGDIEGRGNAGGSLLAVR